MKRQMVVSVISWCDAWFRLSQAERDELLDTKDAWIHPQVGESTSKKRFLTLCLEDAWRARKDEVIEDIYASILKRGFTNSHEIDHYPFILFWLLDNINGGEIRDDCGIYNCLAEFYRKPNIENAIKYQMIAYEMIDNCINEYVRAKRGNRDDGLKQFRHTGYMLVIYLMDAKRFSASIEYESACITRGLFDEESRVMLNYLRFDAIREYHKNGTTSFLDDIDLLLFDNECMMGKYKYILAEHLKLIGNEFYKQKDYENAKNYYENAISIWPSISGAKTKLQYTLNKIKNR